MHQSTMIGAGMKYGMLLFTAATAVATTGTSIRRTRTAGANVWMNLRRHIVDVVVGGTSTTGSRRRCRCLSVQLYHRHHARFWNLQQRPLEVRQYSISTPTNKLASSSTCETTSTAAAAALPQQRMIHQQQKEDTITLIDNDSNTTNQQQPPTNDSSVVKEGEDEQQQRPMTYYERTMSFSKGIYHLYQHYQLYHNISSAYATAISNFDTNKNNNNNNNTTGSGSHHAWAHRYQSLYEQSRHHDPLSTTSSWDGSDRHTVLASAVSFLLQQQQQQQQHPPNHWMKLMMMMIPYRQQQQQYQFVTALQQVTPTVVLAMLPIIGYLPMFLAILLPRQLLCRHFYNTYEVLYYNTLSYQQRRQHYYDNNKRNTSNNNHPPTLQDYWIQQLQHPSSVWNTTGTTTTTNVNRTTGSAAAMPTTMTTTTMTTNQVTKRYDNNDDDSTILSLFRTTPPQLLQLKSYPRDYLIRLALVTGMYSTVPVQLQYITASYCTPTFLLRHHIRTIIQRIVQNDLLLLCEELLISSLSLLPTTTVVSSYVQNNMTDIELSDACLLRGLPICEMIQNTTSTNGNRNTMNESLSDHLRIVALLLHHHRQQQIQRQPKEGTHNDDKGTITDQDMERIGLFVIHLPFIRSHMEQIKMKNCHNSNE